MHSPSETLHRWLCSPSIEPPPHVSAAMARLDAVDEERAQHWINWSAEALDKFFDLVDQQRLEFSARDRRANARLNIARYLETQVCPYVADPEVLKLPGRLRRARQSGVWCIRPSDGKKIIRWDEKAGLPLLCPDDAREESKRLERRVLEPLLAQVRAGRSVHHFVFTLENFAPGKLRQGMRKIFRQFGALLKKRVDGKLRFPAIKGYIATLEAPLSRHWDWNVHLNVILVTEGYLSYQDVRAAWGSNVHMQPVRGDEQAIKASLRELIKYPVRTVAEKADEERDLRQSDNAPSAVRMRDASVRTVEGEAAASAGCPALHSAAQAPAAMPLQFVLRGPDEVPDGSSEGALRASPARCDAIGPAAGLDRHGTLDVLSDHWKAPPLDHPPAMEDWPPALWLEWWQAHRRFRRTRTGKCLYKLPKPEKLNTSEFVTGGTVRYVERERRFHFRSSLLDSIPGDKSTTPDHRERLKAHLRKVLGDPDGHRQAIEIMQRAMQSWR